jgi:hypothetical protein
LAVFEDVQRGIGILHKHEFVFWDLREGDIPEVDLSQHWARAILIDFDWCGRANEATYLCTLGDFEAV